MFVHACRYVVLALREISIAHRCAARSVYASVTTRQRHVHVHVTSLIKGIHVIDDFLDLFIIFKVIYKFDLYLKTLKIRESQIYNEMKTLENSILT